MHMFLDINNALLAKLLGLRPRPLCGPVGTFAVLFICLSWARGMHGCPLGCLIETKTFPFGFVKGIPVVVPLTIKYLHPL